MHDDTIEQIDKVRNIIKNLKNNESLLIEFEKLVKKFSAIWIQETKESTKREAQMLQIKNEIEKSETVVKATELWRRLSDTEKAILLHPRTFGLFLLVGGRKVLHVVKPKNDNIT